MEKFFGGNRKIAVAHVDSKSKKFVFDEGDSMEEKNGESFEDAGRTDVKKHVNRNRNKV
jgi:hypothetical protein